MNISLRSSDIIVYNYKKEYDQREQPHAFFANVADSTTPVCKVAPNMMLIKLKVHCINLPDEKGSYEYIKNIFVVHKYTKNRFFIIVPPDMDAAEYYKPLLDYYKSIGGDNAKWAKYHGFKLEIQTILPENIEALVITFNGYRFDAPYETQRSAFRRIPFEFCIRIHTSTEGGKYLTENLFMEAGSLIARYKIIESGY